MAGKARRRAEEDLEELLPSSEDAKGTANISTTGARQPRRAVFTATGLPAGSHAVSIVNRGPGSVAVDAMVVH